ncbi:MAG: MFS transporter [Cyanobacteria bacterium HKST-UBA02]|nr:MFS transporter [Cyanobacteria bacterium HKST-UBA02]
MKDQKSKLSVRPSVYIPTLYFAEGLPYTMVNLMSVVFYKNLGASNTFIGWATSFLYLPWTLKFLWSPLVDVRSTKKRWIVVAQMVLAALSLLTAAACFLDNALYVTVSVFLFLGIASATHDVAIDGYYMDVLDREKQAFFVGIRNAAYKVAWLLGSGGLVYLAGKLAESTDLGVKGGWFVAFLSCSVIFLFCSLLHMKILPETGKETGEDQGNETGDATGLSAGKFLSIFLSYLDQPRIEAVVIYILIFRAGDAFMLKMAQPFLLDSPDKGGLGIATSEVGIIYGTVGMLFLLAGGIFGGWLVSRFGLKKCLLPTAVVQNLAILLYYWLAALKPGGEGILFGVNLSSVLASLGLAGRWLDASLIFTTLVNSFEQFSYGLGTAAYTVFLLTTVRRDYKAAHYAIATALMALGLMIPGAVSGNIADSVGYEKFFLFSFLVSIPGIITIFFLPLEK